MGDYIDETVRVKNIIKAIIKFIAIIFVIIIIISFVKNIIRIFGFGNNVEDVGEVNFLAQERFNNTINLLVTNEGRGKFYGIISEYVDEKIAGQGLIYNISRDKVKGHIVELHATNQSGITFSPLIKIRLIIFGKPNMVEKIGKGDLVYFSGIFNRADYSEKLIEVGLYGKSFDRLKKMNNKRLRN